MLKKYATLKNENLTERNVFRDQYYKVISEIREFEEDEAPDGWHEFITTNERPEIPEGKYLCHHYELRDNKLYRTYFLVDSRDDLRLFTLKDYEDAVQNYLDTTVQTRGYDNVYTCLSYKDDPDPIFSREAYDVLAWRSLVWRTAQGILNAWNSGQIEQPTIQQVIDQLPAIEW